MGKTRKVAKSKTAKKKSAGTATSKRPASTSAKTKVAKRNTTKRKGPARRTREEPCPRERDARDRVLEKIRKIEDDLSNFDIPPDLRKDLEVLLEQKQGRLRFLQGKLDECEAKHRPPGK